MIIRKSRSACRTPTTRCVDRCWRVAAVRAHDSIVWRAGNHQSRQKTLGSHVEQANPRCASHRIAPGGMCWETDGLGPTGVKVRLEAADHVVEVRHAIVDRSTSTFLPATKTSDVAGLKTAPYGAVSPWVAAQACDYRPLSGALSQARPSISVRAGNVIDRHHSTRSRSTGLISRRVTHPWWRLFVIPKAA